MLKGGMTESEYGQEKTGESDSPADQPEQPHERDQISGQGRQAGDGAGTEQWLLDPADAGERKD